MAGVDQPRPTAHRAQGHPGLWQLPRRSQGCRTLRMRHQSVQRDRSHPSYCRPEQPSWPWMSLDALDPGTPFNQGQLRRFEQRPVKRRLLVFPSPEELAAGKYATPANADGRAEVGRLAEAMLRPSVPGMGRRTILRLGNKMPRRGERLRAIRKHFWPVSTRSLRSATKTLHCFPPSMIDSTMSGASGVSIIMRPSPFVWLLRGRQLADLSVAAVPSVLTTQTRKAVAHRPNLKYRQRRRNGVQRILAA